MKKLTTYLSIGLIALVLLVGATPTQAIAPADYVISDGVVYSPGSEIVSERGRASRVYYEGDGIYRAEFFSSPEFTEVDGQWVEYNFTDYGDYYALQHPWWSVEFYDYYTVVYDETFTDVKIYDDRWTVEYQNKQGKWTDSSFWNVTRSYEIVSDGVKLRRTGDTVIGQREETYYFRNGSPCKIEIRQTSDKDQTVRFVWKPSGIVADTEVVIEDDSERTAGFNYYDSSGNFVSTMRWFDELDVCSSITPVVETHAQGRKATITFAEFSVAAGGTVILDPDTFYPDDHVEVTSVDGIVKRSTAGGTWADIRDGAGTGADDSSVTGFVWKLRSSVTVNEWYFIQRSIYLFDTSDLPDDVVVSGATFSIYGTNKVDPSGWTPDVNVYKSTPFANTALQADDYVDIGIAALCATPITYAGWDTSGYNNFVLVDVDTDDFGYISLVGVTKLGVRNANYDVADTPPANPGADVTASITGYCAEQGGAVKPKLVVTYAGTPTVTTSAASSVEETTATLNGNVTDIGDTSITDRGFVWDTATHGNPGGTAPGASSYASNWTESGSYGTGAFTHDLTSLTKGELYYVRACAQNDVNVWGYGSEVTFLTKPDPPYNLSATGGVTSGIITLTWDKGSGAQNTYIRGEDGSYPTDRADGYLVYNNTGVTDDDTGLTGGHTYYYRAWSYATEGGKEQYSDAYDEDYALALASPTVTTSSAEDVGNTYATLVADITVLGNGNADYRGFVWDTTSRGDPGNTAPAASAYANYNTEGGSFGTGEFTYYRNSLVSGDTYYYRGCAHNGVGWSYGAEVSFQTLELVLWFQPNTIISGTTMIDRAGSNDGTITWGSNPSGVDVSVGALLPETQSTATVDVESETPVLTPGTEGLEDIMTSGVEGEGFILYEVFKDLFNTWHELGGPDISMPYFWKVVVVALGWMFGTAVMLTTRNLFFGLVAYFLGFAVPAGALGILDLWVPITYGIGAAITCLLVSKWSSSSL